MDPAANKILTLCCHSLSTPKAGSSQAAHTDNTHVKVCYVCICKSKPQLLGVSPLVFEHVLRTARMRSSWQRSTIKRLSHCYHCPCSAPQSSDACLNDACDLAATQHTAPPLPAAPACCAPNTSHSCPAAPHSAAPRPIMRHLAGPAQAHDWPRNARQLLTHQCTQAVIESAVNEQRAPRQVDVDKLHTSDESGNQTSASPPPPTRDHWHLLCAARQKQSPEPRSYIMNCSTTTSDSCSLYVPHHIAM